MAEFTEVMRQAKRMCSVHGGICSYRCCPLANGETCRLNVELDGEDYNELERIIMDWAAKHPEPVYPSWAEGWRRLFPDSKFAPCPDCFGLKYRVDECVSGLTCTACKARPMPAEVAEKLGIKPIAPEKPQRHYCYNCKYAKRKPIDEPCVKCKQRIDCEESVLTAPDLWEAAK